MCQRGHEPKRRLVPWKAPAGIGCGSRSVPSGRASLRSSTRLKRKPLGYSRRAFAMAEPSQAQECVLSAHVSAFNQFGEVR
jgi:hypothetical protein